ncbi:MAG: hypothetical protein QHJ81_02710 [Anaerolineae bacterium]|nr:hypothetical protein [Anaerolineae bacterium]
MSDVSQALNVAQYVVPGFLFVQVLYSLGVARERPAFERGAWSLIFSVPIHWVGTQLIPVLGLEFTPRLTFEVYLLAIALVGSLVIGLLNKFRLFLFSEEQEEEPPA